MINYCIFYISSHVSNNYVVIITGSLEDLSQLCKKETS